MSDNCWFEREILKRLDGVVHQIDGDVDNLDALMLLRQTAHNTLNVGRFSRLISRQPLVPEAHFSVTASRLTHAVPKRPDDPPTLGAFERENYLVLSIPPNIILFANADICVWLLVLPLSAEQTVVCGGGRVSPHRDGPGEAEFQNNDALMQEDRILCERLQRGMKARHGRGGQLVELDRVIKDFHHFLGWRLFDHDLAEAWQDKAKTELRVAAGNG